MMSGHGTIETAVRATQLGAFDFIEKPLSAEKLLLTLRHALERASLERENRELRAKSIRAHDILGSSVPVQRLKEQIQVAGPTNGWVLITGENGTGKEMVAKQLHVHSKRASGPFVEVNCAAIPEELIESELFGHEKGAFTGAIAQKRGKFELAHGGTIFLDEIGDMSLRTQAKILRILQEHEFERVGGTETLSVDVRVIAATNKSLEKEIQEGKFREDLYYRLNVIPFHVPPLRERREDIPRAREVVRGGILRRVGRASEAGHGTRADAAPGLRLAGQRARAAQPDRTARADDARPAHPPPGPAGGAALRHAARRDGRRDARRGAPRVRAALPARPARGERVERLAHGGGDRPRAREPLAQDAKLQAARGA